LMEAGDLIMESAGYHQANMIEGYLAQLASMFPNGPPEAPAADPPPQEAPPADDKLHQLLILLQEKCVNSS